MTHTQLDNSHRRDKHHTNLILTLSRTRLSISIRVLLCWRAQINPLQLSSIILSVTMLSVIMLSIIMLSVIMLTVVMLTVVMMRVTAPQLLDQESLN